MKSEFIKAIYDLKSKYKAAGTDEIPAERFKVATEEPGTFYLKW